MTRRLPKGCSTPLLLLLPLLALVSGGAAAHDIDVTGVARLILDERQDPAATDAASYSLAVVDARVPPLFNIEYSLPARCEALVPSRASYRFRCNPSLRSDDSLRFPWALAGAVLIVNWMDGSSHSSYYRGDGAFIEAPLAEVRAPSAALGRLAQQYALMGVEHIVFGVDHLLFVIGLVLLLGIKRRHSDRLAPRYLKAITAFTFAHSLTLGASVLGYAHAPSAPVEILIALSIVLLAREAIEAQRGRFSLSFRRPWIVCFAFGLIHGFGFASALGELGLNAADIPSALLFFNLGVEAGQLAIVFGALASAGIGTRLIALLGSKGANVEDTASAKLPLAPSLERTTSTALAYLLGGVATYWLLDRIPTLWLA